MELLSALAFFIKPIKLAAFPANRQQMPVYGHSHRLLKPCSAANSNCTGHGVILPQRPIIKINRRVLTQGPANIGAPEPVVKLRTRDARWSKTVVQGVAAVD
jgi:hypothetical protein